jgi:large subunit ribosomal protein L1
MAKTKREMVEDENSIENALDALKETEKKAEAPKETKKETVEKGEKPKAGKKAKKVSSKPKKRSKKYLEKFATVEHANKKYSAKEAITLVKALSYTKFDGSINLAVKLEKAKKAEDAVRGTINLPNGTGKKLRVVVASDDIIEEVKKGKINFDILVSTPAMMSKLGVLAKVLGPKGKMPNPKDGTVTDKPDEVAKDLSENIIRYRTDLGRNVHIPIGKISWSEEKLLQNYLVAMKSLSKLKIESATLSPTMGPGVKVDIKSI